MLKNRQLPSTCSKQNKKNCPPFKHLKTTTCSSSSSSISIDPPKGCLRFFSKNTNLHNHTLQPPTNPLPISRSKENVPENTFPVDNYFSQTGFKRMSSKCLMRVIAKQKDKNFTLSVTNDEMSIGRVGKLASGSVFESEVDKRNSKAALSKCLKENPKQKQNKKKPVANGEPGDLPEIREEHELGIGRNGKLASGSAHEFELDKPNSKAGLRECLKENRKQKQVINDELDYNFVEKSTPVNKLDKTATDIAISSTSTSTKTTTPPVQASVSPEINCASSSSLLAVSAAKTPACYGAGHIVSGVTDRRKCRARGILTVGQKVSSCINLNEIENGDDLGVVRKSRMSLVPFPAEASMHWLLSPCEEVYEDRGTNRSSGHRNVLDLCNVLDSSSSGNFSSGRGSKITLLSPSRNLELEGLSGGSSGKAGGSSLSASSGKKVRKNRYDPIIKSSPFSSGSLGSGNVIQTPQSESSSDRQVRMSCLNASEKRIYGFGYDIDCATEDLLRANLSPKINRSFWDSPGFSFHLPEFVSPSDCVDLSQLQNTWTNGSSSVSNSWSNEMSTSHMRVSWRDGLASRIFEMDESDFCRCLSDDESGAKKNSNGKLKSSMSHEMKDEMCDSDNCENEIRSLEFVAHVPKYDVEREEEFDEKRSNLCEESISADGGGLAASGDSDWTSCYKNQLFEL